MDFDVISATDLLQEQISGGQFIFDGLVRDNSFIGVFGPAKHLKSFFLQSMAISIASGEDFLGIPVDRKRRVLYIPRESPRWGLQQRIRRLADGVALSPDKVKNLKIITNQQVRLDVPESVSALRRAIEKYQTEVVIIDPLAQSHRLNENDTGDMIAICDAFLSLRDEMDQTVIISHHTNRNALSKKVGQSKEGMIRGNLALWASLDGGIFLMPTSAKHTQNVEVELKEGGEIDPFFLKIEDISNGNDHDVVLTMTGVPQKAVKPNRSQQQAKERDAVVAFVNGAGRLLLLPEVQAQFPDMKDRPLRNLLNAAFDAGEIHREPTAKNAYLFGPVKSTASTSP